MKKPSKGRVTIPTDMDVIPQTLEIMEKWGADAIRDCDGTSFPKELADTGAKVYATYYTTRKDNVWAKNNPDEVQQCYICTSFHMAEKQQLSIPLMTSFSREMLLINTRDDIHRWWEVINRSTGEVVRAAMWQYDEKTQAVVINNCTPYHEYSVSFLAYLIWDPVHMYNAVVNNWQEVEHQITFDVRQPKTLEFSKKRLRLFLEENPFVSVVRFTTFFHQFTLLFDELRREKYVDWYGYSASISPYVLQQFEKEVGYTFRAEYIIDEGYYNSQYRIPSPQFRDYMAFQRREVACLAKEFVDITHEYGKQAMMFLGDHWIGTEPFMEEFKSIGLDAVVGSVGNGSTLRLISDIKGVGYTEGRFLPYFFPDTFHKGGKPTEEAMHNWVTARRAILRKPIDRIGYGGYLKLAIEFPDFVDYITQITDDFRTLYENIRGTVPFTYKKVAVLNAWGKMRAWGTHMVHHALYQKQNYSYAGVIEALAGAPYDVHFISFEDILQDKSVLEDVDVIINVGGAGTAHSGGTYWQNPDILANVRGFIANGGGFIGIGEPTAVQHQGRFFQLGAALGVEEETGLTLGFDKYNWEEVPHFITEECKQPLDFGEGQKNIYALEGTQILCQREKEVQLAANSYADGRCVYISGLPYSHQNMRLLHRALLWSCKAEEKIHTWLSENPALETNAYPQNNKFCVVNNSYEEQHTKVWKENGECVELTLEPGGIRWFKITE